MVSKYYSHVRPELKRIPAWRRQGLTERQVAKKLHIAYSTLNKYKLEHSELAEALKRGKEELVEELETSIYKKAMGYEYEEVETTIEKRGNTSFTRQKKYSRKAQPDTGALCFVLKNLAPDRWRDRPEEKELLELKAGKLSREIDLMRKVEANISDANFQQRLESMFNIGAEDENVDG